MASRPPSRPVSRPPSRASPAPVASTSTAAAAAAAELPPPTSTVVNIHRPLPVGSERALRFCHHSVLVMITSAPWDVSTKDVRKWFQDKNKVPRKNWTKLQSVARYGPDGDQGQMIPAFRVTFLTIDQYINAVDLLVNNHMNNLGHKLTDTGPTFQVHRTKTDGDGGRLMLLIMNKGPGKRIDLRDAPDTDKNDGLMEFDDLD